MLPIFTIHIYFDSSIYGLLVYHTFDHSCSLKLRTYNLIVLACIYNTIGAIHFHFIHREITFVCACPYVWIFRLFSFKVRYAGSFLFRYSDEWTGLRLLSIRLPSNCLLRLSLPFDHWWVYRMYVPIQINRRLYRRDGISLENLVSTLHSNIPLANRRHYRRHLNIKYETFNELHASHVSLSTINLPFSP